MILRGEFRDLSDELLTVLIKSGGGSGTVKEIGKDGLYFAADPVQIEESIDITEHVIRKSATINLVVSDYLGDLLFTGAARDIVVNIWKGSECIFAGYVEPATFCQPFNSNVDEFTLNCTDYLSTLQYTSYKNIVPLNYRRAVQEAGSTSFMEVLGRIFDTRGLNLNNNQKPRLLYDQSKGTAKGKEGTVFEELSISELFIIGKDEDSTWKNEDLLKEVMQYLNLHIRQEGLDFYIYDWDTLVQGNTINWLDLQTGEVVSKQPQSIIINPSHYAGSDTSLSTSEVVNQFQLSCSLEGQDTIIESPLAEDSLKSHYKGQQLFLTEISSLGSGKSANESFNAAVKGQPTTYDALTETDWYMRAMYNPTWKLRKSDDMLEVDENGTGINQHKVAQYLRDHPLTPALLRLGSVERKAKATDNSPTSKIDTDNYLVISVGGNENDTAEGHKPSDNDLRDCSPLIEYVGNKSGGVFSPPDPDTTNYLVFSGSLLMQPILYESGIGRASRVSSYDQILKYGARKTQGKEYKAVVPFYDPPRKDNVLDLRNLDSNLVKSEGNDEGRYYTRKHYSATYNTDKPTYNSGASYFQPWTKDKSSKGLQFEYSSVGDSTDKFSKLPILECELKIGSKYCVETVLDVYGNSKFEWLTMEEIKERPDLTYKDDDGTTKYKTTMSLGIDPKIGDFIVGVEHPLQNTISYTQNLDSKEGTAIPIKQSDRLSGRVSFKILAPIQLVWDNIVRRHPTFFRSTKWTSNSRYILAHTENIIIKNFACNIVSDNGKLESTSDNDLIYSSAAQTKYINKHDGTEFKFLTQLSSSEAVEKGIKNEVYLNSVFNTSTSLPVRSIYNKVLDETGKAEEHYVSQYYNFMSRPRLKVEVTMNDIGIDFTSTYQSKTLGKKFLVQSVSRDIRNKTARITLLEI
jgi:hypothetical protein|nr:MAG TPA: hypothetical protein [Caudoviricetes sp.]